MACAVCYARGLIHRAPWKFHSHLPESLGRDLRKIWVYAEGLSVPNYSLAYGCDLGLQRDIWASRWLFFTFVS